MKPAKAYIGFSRGSSWVSKAIRKLDGGYYNHVYLRFDFAPDGALIYESHLSGGVQITPYEAMLAAKVRGVVEDVIEFDLDLDPLQCELLYNNCIPEHGDHYNKMQIAKYYFWIRLAKRKARKYINKLSDKYTCNMFVIKVCKDIVPAMSGLDYSFTIKPLYDLACIFFKVKKSNI